MKTLAFNCLLLVFLALALPAVICVTLYDLNTEPTGRDFSGYNGLEGRYFSK